MTALDPAPTSAPSLTQREVTIRKKLQEVIGPLTDLLRSYPALPPEPTVEDLDDAENQLQALNDLLDELTQLVLALEELPDLSVDGARFAGAARAGMWLIDAARTTITAELDAIGDDF